MSCFSCIGSRRSQSYGEEDIIIPKLKINSNIIIPSHSSTVSSLSSGNGKRRNGKRKEGNSPKGGTARSFTLKELAAATENFNQENLIGEGGFGKVYKGVLETNYQVVAIKQLDNDGLQGFQEFVVEVLMLSLLHHPNLVTLIGYCADGDERLLVYEFMPMGSLENHLFDNKVGLSWRSRMKIAAGAAKGLEYLHCTANPPVIYRDMKAANILLDNDLNPKLSDFGLAKLGPVGDDTHVSTRVMGTYGYCAPEYAMSGKLTLKSDIYTFGVLLLELITGRKAIDLTRKPGDQSLIAWSRPYLKDRRKFVQMADPLLNGQVPPKALHQAIAVTAMCLQDQPSSRPHISDIVVALDYLLASAPNSPQPPLSTPTPPHSNTNLIHTI